LPHNFAVDSKPVIEKLDRIYFCMTCHEKFLFQSDVENHKEMRGHWKIQVLPLA
jgi:hypothetical protein